MAPRPATLVALIAAYVLVSSLLGLGTPMAIGGPDVFAAVWGASPGGSLLFLLGMGVLGVMGFFVSQRGFWWAAVILGALGSWLVYALSWSLTGPAMDPEESDFSADEAWAFAATWGWPGILFSAVFPALVVRLMDLRSSSLPSVPVPQQEEPKRHA